MSFFKCKMCGGSLEVAEGTSIYTCEFCGTQQTIPTVKSEELQILFNRANALRMRSEFDKAAEIYEKILHKSDTESEAYWGLILCKYGIEYVEDPATYKRIPTCHRTSFDAVVTDEDYLNAIRYADSTQRSIYEAEAAAIDEIQKGIIALAQKEEAYDVFICYKETDRNGKRTPDSSIANDIYYQLTNEGFKVFFAAITLEDKLGREYEPYIFSALNTAKVMLCIGTRPEYFNAAWVKNEWSRFLKIMKEDRSRLLIPCYRDMDPYELPEEFAHLQAQDMSKIGFINDVVRGIKKVIVKEDTKPVSQKTIITRDDTSTSAGTQIKRGNMALEDCEWDKADSFFEMALNLDPERAEAYIGKLLARDRQPDFDSWLELQERKYESVSGVRLEACPEQIQHISEMAEKMSIAGYLSEDTIRQTYVYDRNYISVRSSRAEQKERQLRELSDDRLLNRARRYAKGSLKEQIESGIKSITAVLDRRIAQAERQDAASSDKVRIAYADYIREADRTAEMLNADALNRREEDYRNAVFKAERADGIDSYKAAKVALNALNGYKDSQERAALCQLKICTIEEDIRQTAKQRAEEKRVAAKKRNQIIAFASAAVCICIVLLWVVTKVVIPNDKYNAAVDLMNEGQNEEAFAAFKALNGYRDSEEMAENIYENYMAKEVEVGDYICFGSYEQDNDTSNGKEDIEWLVLAKKNNNLLVISKYALNCQQYNESYKNVTWNTCSVRRWLNNKFINLAFSSGEKAKISTVTVPADENPECNTDPGYDTKDRIFLLSIAEVNKYFPNSDDRRCSPTAYAIAKGAWTSAQYQTDENATCWWWLRSPGYYPNYAATVNGDGSVRYDGSGVIGESGCVRPAMWINLG